jgi:hypothetical protein
MGGKGKQLCIIHGGIYIYMQPPHLFGWVFNLWTAIHQSMDITLMQLGHTYTYKYCWGIAFSTMG